MSVTISLPEAIEHQLEDAWGEKNLSRKALESLVIEAYREGKLSAGQVAEALGLSVIETEAFLKERGVALPYTLEDLEQDRDALKRALSR
jgi:predicted HTH domain antitoxin